MTRAVPRCGGSCLAALAVLTLAGCQRVGVAPPGSVPSVAACAATGVDTSDWTLVRETPGVTYRVPDDFTERLDADSPFRTFVPDADTPGRIMVGFSPSANYYVSQRRAPSPGMLEMSECVAESGGREVLLQAWRTEGGAFRGGQRYDLYEVHALVPVGPSRTLFVTGGGPDPRFQKVILAVARTVRVEP